MLRLRVPRYPAGLVLRCLALAYLIAWVLSPPLAFGSTWRILALLAMALWLAMELAAPRSVLLRPTWPTLGCVVYVLYTLGVELLYPDSVGINQQFPIWFLLFFLVVGESHQRGRWQESRFCFWMVLLVLPIWAYTTLRGLDTISLDVARTAVRSSAESERLARQGIGGFGLVYTTVLCLPFLAQLAMRSGRQAGPRNWRRRVPRLLIWCNFVLVVLLVLRAGYSIALLLSAIALAGVLIVRSRRAVPLAISMTLAGLLVVVGSQFLEPALQSMQSISQGTEYAAKVRDVRDTLKSEDSVGTFDGRMRRYARSFWLFTEHPVVGNLEYDGVGGHSAILDRYAQYGFGIGTLFFWLLAYVPFRTLRDRRIPIGMALALVLIAVGFPLLNPVFMSWGLVLYVFSRGALQMAAPALVPARGALPISAGADGRAQPGWSGR